MHVGSGWRYEKHRLWFSQLVSSADRKISLVETFLGVYLDVFKAILATVGLALTIDTAWTMDITMDSVFRNPKQRTCIILTKLDESLFQSHQSGLNKTRTCLAVWNTGDSQWAANFLPIVRARVTDSNRCIYPGHCAYGQQSTPG